MNSMSASHTSSGMSSQRSTRSGRSSNVANLTISSARKPSSARRGQDPARAGGVAVHLPHERLGRREAPLAALAAHELQAHLLAIEFLVDVEEVDLERSCAA